jgi:hypothetical protein
MTLSRPPPHYLLKQNINGTWSVGNNTVPRFRANCEVAAKGIFLCSMTGQATFDMFIEKNKRTVFHVGFETGVYATPATNDMNKLDIPSSGDSMLYTASGTCEDQ